MASKNKRVGAAAGAAAARNVSIAPRRTVGIRVRATQTGYYDHARRRPGDVFTIADEQAFSKRWMEKVTPETPESLSTSNDEIRRRHDEILSGKVQDGIQVGPDSVASDLPTGTGNPLDADA